jgi:excinuclease UvrABC nuclease subunit
VDIPGVGERIAEKLLRQFGSVANLRQAGLEELSKVVTRPQAQRILEQLRGARPSE